MGKRGHQHNSDTEQQGRQQSREEVWIIRAQTLIKESHRAAAQTSEEGHVPTAATILRICTKAGSESTKETGNQNQQLLLDEGQCLGDTERNN